MLASGAHAQSNLIPNPDFNEMGDPLKTWRIDFPYQQPYAKNAGYVRISPDKKQGSANVVEITLPKGVAENEGGKIESAFVKAQPGATYRAAVDCMTNDLSVKLYVLGWAVDPTPPGAPNIDRIPARDGMPALVRIYRAQFEAPRMSKVWTTARREFKLPDKAIVGGQPSQPAFVSFEVFAYSDNTGTLPMAKSYYTRFSLTASK